MHSKASYIRFMINDFENKLVDLASLPKVEAVQYHVLSAKYIKVVWIQSLLFSLLFVAGGLVPYYQYTVDLESRWTFEIALVFALLGVLLACFFIGVSVLGVHKKGYAIRECDLVYKTGLITRKIIIIPYNRVQHVALYEGMLLRFFQLTRLEFYTAGGNFGDLKIAGISKEEAERIKAFVVRKVDASQDKSSEEAVMKIDLNE